HHCGRGTRACAAGRPGPRGHESGGRGRCLRTRVGGTHGPAARWWPGPRRTLRGGARTAAGGDAVMSGRRFAVVLAALLVAAPTAAQPPRTGMQQRAMMEELLLERFLDTVARDIRLSAEQRTRVGEILRASAGRHRTRMTEGQRLRRELIAAVDAEGTTDEEFVALLERM